MLGWAEFAGLRLRVAPGVFVPRRRTELLLRMALVSIHAAGESTSAGRLGRAAAEWRPSAPPRVLELCCGVAPVATALAARLGAASVTASDLDPDAVAVARANLEPRGGVVLQGDLFAGLPAGARYDVIVANAPYVPTAELLNLPREARDYEHPLALDGGDDGLALHRRIAAEAAAWLAPGGAVLVETSRRQASVDLAIFETHGWRAELESDDELDATAVRAVLARRQVRATACASRGSSRRSAPRGR